MTPLPTQNKFFILFQLSLFILLGPLNTFAQESVAPKPPKGMAYIPEGYFQMGTSSGRDDEKPMHFVYTSAYFIDKFEVSNAQYMEFVKATDRAKPKYWQDENFNHPEAPVVGVDWHDAMEYAKWKNRRLPTEAEWEKAARGNDGRLWPWGDKWEKGFVPYYVNISGEEDQYKFTAPTTYYESGASPFGLFNTAGNVWEWCLDWYLKDYYRISPEVNPPGPEPGSATMKSLRGGSWVNSIDSVRVVQRARNLPSTKNEIYGFRTVLPIP